MLGKVLVVGFVGAALAPAAAQGALPVKVIPSDVIPVPSQAYTTCQAHEAGEACRTPQVEAAGASAGCVHDYYLTSRSEACAVEGADASAGCAEHHSYAWRATSDSFGCGVASESAAAECAAIEYQLYGAPPEMHRIDCHAQVESGPAVAACDAYDHSETFETPYATRGVDCRADLP